MKYSCLVSDNVCLESVFTKRSNKRTKSVIVSACPSAGIEMFPFSLARPRAGICHAFFFPSCPLFHVLANVNVRSSTCWHCRGWFRCFPLVYVLMYHISTWMSGKQRADVISTSTSGMIYQHVDERKTTKTVMCSVISLLL